MPKRSNESLVIERFHKDCLSTCSERRLIKIRRVLVHSKEILKKDLTKLKVDDVVDYLVAINQSEFKAWTKNDHKKIFKRFLKWYYKDLEMIEGSRVKEGFKGASKKKAFNKEKINKNTLLTKEELNKLVRAAKSLKWKAMITFAYESGFRPCEIRAIKWKDLKFDDSLGICRAWILSPKTGDPREVPVKDCVLHLKRWRDEYQFADRSDKDYVFPSQHLQDKPMGYGVMVQMFKRLSEAAGIRPIFPYLLRHSRIYELQKRLPEKIAAKFAGHSIETSEIYNHLADDDVEESMLKEIYPTKERTKEERDNLEQEIANLRAEMEAQFKLQNGEIDEEEHAKIIAPLRAKK